MDRAARCRRAARDAVADVEPPRLHEVIADVLDDASMTPAVLTLESATAIDPSISLETIAPRVAGVQLVYEGLRLTRTLAQTDPWSPDGQPTPTSDRATTDPTDGDTTTDVTADLEILAADILVARGFYLLARTDAAEKAVHTVRAFGRDQTRRDDPGVEAADVDANLERDVLELAVRTGASVANADPRPDLLAVAADLADASDTDLLAAARVPRVGSSETPVATDGEGEPEGSGEAGSPGDGPQTDRATSASDP